MKIAIMQPTFNPWLGYFEMIDYVDKFIFFDTVQFMRRDWQTRNKFIVQGKEHLFTIPVKKTKHRSETKIFEAEINFLNYDFRKKLLLLIESNYKKAKFFNQVHSFILDLIQFETPYLSEYNINLITKLANKIGINSEFIILSKTNFNSNKKKGDLILDICKFFKTNIYVSPIGAKEYMKEVLEKFKKENIDVIFQNYNHPTYPQLSKNFLSHIGILDLIYNVGFEKAKDIIISGRNYFKI